MSARKTERLLNLVLCLLSTRRFLTVHQIRESVSGYDQADSDEAFRRMFERDKEELRELGIPLETGSTSVWDDDPGYRIARRDYELPEITLSPDEAAAVGVAARFWTEAGLAADASAGLLKLRAAGIDVQAPLLPGLEPRVEAGEAAFEPLLAATRAGYPVAFDYRSPSADAPGPRRLEPWGVVSWHGHWYVAGYDLDRRAPRVFRLSRVVGEVTPIAGPATVEVPDGVDVRAMVAQSVHRPEDRMARVRVRPGTAYPLRRRARRVLDDGDLLEVAFGELEVLVDEIAGYGADAVLIDPPEARAALIERFRAVVELLS